LNILAVFGKAPHCVGLAHQQCNILSHVPLEDEALVHTISDVSPEGWAQRSTRLAKESRAPFNLPKALFNAPYILASFHGKYSVVNHSRAM
jgi:hypothetical protein